MEIDLNIDTLIYGTTENCPFRGGTPALPLIVSFAKAMRLANDKLDSNIKKCEKLKEELLKGLSKYPIQINSNDLCVPQIVNFSLMEIINNNQKEIILAILATITDDIRRDKK